MIKTAFGLIGYPLSHSFSKKYFADKFEKEIIDWASYDNFPIEHIDQLAALIEGNPQLRGLNVTIPYKQQVIEFMDYMDPDAAAIGAVNTIVIEAGKKSGYNSDIYGFEKSLGDLIPDDYHQGALLLGTGGAAKAVAFVLARRSIPFRFVSRTEGADRWSYDQIDHAILQDYRLLINCTPLGMHPNVEQSPAIPYPCLDSDHYLYDLIYNPAETQFLAKGAAEGAATKNGLDMLILQAERSWEIWNTER